LRLFINWFSRQQEYTADAFSGNKGYNRILKEALVITFIKNDDHLAPDEYFTMVKKYHPNINQRIKALDMQYNQEGGIEGKKINGSGLNEPLIQKN